MRKGTYYSIVAYSLSEIEYNKDRTFHVIDL